MGGEPVSAAKDSDWGWRDQWLSQGASHLRCHSDYSARIPVSSISFTFPRVHFTLLSSTVRGLNPGMSDEPKE